MSQNVHYTPCLFRGRKPAAILAACSLLLHIALRVFHIGPQATVDDMALASHCAPIIALHRNVNHDALHNDSAPDDHPQQSPLTFCPLCTKLSKTPLAILPQGFIELLTGVTQDFVKPRDVILTQFESRRNPQTRAPPLPS